MSSLGELRHVKALLTQSKYPSSILHHTHMHTHSKLSPLHLLVLIFLFLDCTQTSYVDNTVCSDITGP